MPDKKLPHACGFDDGRRAVAGLRRGEGSPDFLAVILIKSDGDAAFAADQADEAIVVDEGMGGETPKRRRDAIIFLEVARPEDLTGHSFEAEEVADRAERVDLAAATGRRAAWAVGIRDVIGARIFMLPFQRAGLGIEALHAFLASIFFAIEVIIAYVSLGKQIGYENEAVR